jgi:microcystin-dependent protein
VAQPFLGEIRLFAGNFAPVGWEFCNGQLLQISQNDAIFALIGTTYGGDGVTTFALPDLRGRAPVHQGGGFTIGQVAGSEQVTLTTNELPAHGHPLRATAADGTTADPTNAVWAESDARTFSTAAPNTSLHPSSLGNAGGGQPHSNLMPFVTLNFIIALQGVFPSQN